MKLPFKILTRTNYIALNRQVQRLSVEMKDALAFVEKIEKGDLDATYTGQYLSSELAQALQAMKQEFQRLAEKEKERNWANKGFAKFVDIFRTDSDSINELAQNIIAAVVSYMDANQGGIFVMNDDNPNDTYLELIASYAYNRKKFLERKILPGEGLIGQVYLEGQTTYFTDIPAHYLKITSGLGETTPKNIIILPLKYNKEVYGVIELATFHEWKSYQIDFIERLSENIATAIASVKISQNTRLLLMESQEHSEMLLSQEEEMRQNLEELQATQEELSRKQFDLQDALRESENKANDLKNKENELKEAQKLLQNIIDSIPVAVYWKDRDLKYLGCNLAFAKMAGVEAKDIIGKSDENMPWQARAEDIHQSEINILISRKPKLGVEEQVELGKDKKQRWLRVNRAPLLDIEGQAYGLLGVFEDISEEKARQAELKEKMNELKATQAEMLKNQKEVELINKKLKTNENVLQKALLKAKEREKEIKAKNEELRSVEEEQRQNMEFLSQINDEFEAKQKELQDAKKKLERNASVLQKALDDAKRKTQEAEIKNAELRAAEEELRQQAEELKSTNEQFEAKQRELLKTQQKLERNSSVLEKAFTVSHERERELQEKNAQLAAIEEEVRQNMEELQAVNEQLESTQQELQMQKTALDEAAIVAITDKKGTITYINDKFCEISKYSREELIGQNHRILNSGHHPKSFFVDMWKNIAKGNVWRGEVKNKAKDGSFYWVATTIAPELDERGQAKTYLAIRFDITDRKNQELALQQSYEELQATEEEIRQNLEEVNAVNEQLAQTQVDLQMQKQALDVSAIVAITDKRGIITYVNDKFCKISKYSRSELIGQDHKILNSGHHPKSFFVDMWKTIAQGKVWTGEIKNKAKDGSFYWVATTIAPELDERGQAKTYLAIRFDITDRKNQEFALQQSFEELQATEEEIRQNLEEVNAVNEQLAQTQRDLQMQKSALDEAAIVAVTDKKGTITYINDKFCEISKYSREELIGQNHRILNSGHHPKSFFVDMWKTIAQGKVWKAEIKNKAKDGSFYWVATTIVPKLDEDGKPKSYLAIRFDITVQKKQVEELALQQKLLQSTQSQLDKHESDLREKMKAFSQDKEAISKEIERKDERIAELEAELKKCKDNTSQK